MITHDYALYNTIKTTNDEKFLDEMSKHENEMIKILVAENIFSSQMTLERLSKDSYMIRKCLYKNPSLDFILLSKMIDNETSYRLKNQMKDLLLSIRSNDLKKLYRRKK